MNSRIVRFTVHEMPLNFARHTFMQPSPPTDDRQWQLVDWRDARCARCDRDSDVILVVCRWEALALDGEKQ